MRLVLKYSAVLVMAFSLVALGACKSSAPLEDMPVAPASPPPAPRVIEEEVVTEPVTEPIVSEEAQEVLPEDLELLNARGYLENVFFDTDQWDIKPEYREALAKNAGWLQQYPSIRILVEGHCDERNTREYNLALGERRANAVRDYLVFLGVGAERVRTISYGEERPFALGHNEDAWQLNRRANFVITAR